MLKKHLLFILLVFIALFTYYCGTTAVVEEESDGTIGKDIIVRTDVGIDATGDILGTDTIPNDVVGELPLSDTMGDIIYEDLVNMEDTQGEDTEPSDSEIKDIEYDVLDDIINDIRQDGGGDGGGRDTGLSDNEFTDTSNNTYSISGKVTVNGGKPASGKSVYVIVFDQLPAEGANPIAFTTTDSNDDYLIDGLASGKYYVVAIYDLNGDGKPNPDEGDPIGYYPNNPVEIKNGSLTGINIDIRTIQLGVTSLFMQRQQSRNAYLISLIAKVLDPKTGTPLTDATVTAMDPVSSQVYTLTYNSQTGQYERQFNPYSQNAVIAREGNYQFTIQHPSYGSQPVKLDLPHKPQNRLVTILQPQNNSTVKVNEDVVVEWENPSPSDANILIQLMRRAGSQMVEVFRDEKQPIPNPYVIKGSYINQTGMYMINVVSGRFVIVQNGVSIEATSGTVIINAQ